MIYLLLLFFVIGAFVGSLNCYISNRICKHESIFKGFKCDNCNHKISWYESIPILSFIFLRGKCKKCKIKIPREYIFYELLGGLLFSLAYYLYGFTYELFIVLILFNLLINVNITDFKYMIILDITLIISLVGILLTYLIAFDFYHLLMIILLYLYDGILIFILLLLIKLIGDRLLKQDSLGWGDLKITIIAGLLFGFKGGLIFILIATLLAIPYGLYFVIKHKNTRFPFGPFLVTSMCILYILYPYISNLLSMIGVEI